jgi:hypothetical protein
VKILFLCSSLEPGRDGVGDYTLRLSRRLQDLGHQTVCVALNDKHLAASPALHESADDDSSLLRLSAFEPWSQRWARVGTVMDVFKPEWVSLQFVPWGFHKKGLPFSLGTKIRRIAGGTPIHLMCHELWLDGVLPLPLRQRLLGSAQKCALKHIFTQLSPRVVHTHLEYYRELLARIGISSSLLPLHGNIPVVSTPSEGREFLSRTTGATAEDYIAGFFGNLWQTMDADLLERVVADVRLSGKKMFVVCAGSHAPSGIAAWRKIGQQVGRAATLVKVGELNACDSSSYISGLDVGLTSYPEQLAGKSGAVATMLEHGVSVRTVGRLRKRKGTSRLLVPDAGATVAQTAERFLQTLANSKGS